MMSQIQLGDKVRDSITGFEGTAIARTEHLNGCVQYDVVPKVNEKNEVQDTMAIDEEQLKVIESKKKKEAKSKPPGGGHRPKPRGRK